MRGADLVPLAYTCSVVTAGATSHFANPKSITVDVRLSMFDEKWHCRDGRRLSVYQMTDSHICNCVAMIRRSRGLWRAYWLPRLEAELATRYSHRRLFGE